MFSYKTSGARESFRQGFFHLYFWNLFERKRRESANNEEKVSLVKEKSKETKKLMLSNLRVFN